MHGDIGYVTVLPTPEVGPELTARNPRSARRPSPKPLDAGSAA
jgi:hypothetical protein